MKFLVLALIATASLSAMASVNNKATSETDINEAIKNIQIQITKELEENKAPANVNDTARTHNEKELTITKN
jgi:hypothetical protein